MPFYVFLFYFIEIVDQSCIFTTFFLNIHVLAFNSFLITFEIVFYTLFKMTYLLRHNFYAIWISIIDHIFLFKYKLFVQLDHFCIVLFFWFLSHTRVNPINKALDISALLLNNIFVLFCCSTHSFKHRVSLIYFISKCIANFLSRFKLSFQIKKVSF